MTIYHILLGVNGHRIIPVNEVLDLGLRMPMMAAVKEILVMGHFCEY